MKGDSVIIWGIVTGVLCFSAGMFAEGEVLLRINIPDAVWLNLIVTFGGGAWIALVTSHILSINQKLSEMAADLRGLVFQEFPDGKYQFSDIDSVRKLRGQLQFWTVVFEREGQSDISEWCEKISNVLEEMEGKRFEKTGLDYVAYMVEVLASERLSYLPIFWLKYLWPRIKRN